MTRFALVLLATVFIGCSKPKSDFCWGVSTSAYQVEGGWRDDGKGPSQWDVMTNQRTITLPFTGQQQTGNMSINMYDRTQYLQDIALMKQLGINTFRFSIAWTRILPDGTGAVNEKGIEHYRKLIDDLTSNGIEPFITLYHFDMPQALMEKGGWANPESVQWFSEYAKVVFDNFGSTVGHFITFNEVFMEHFFMDMLTDSVAEGESINARYARQFPKLHHQLLASAVVTRMYKGTGLPGKIGITFNMSPCLPADPASPRDREAALLEDQLLNQFVLNPLYKGAYPRRALDSLTKYAPSFIPDASEMKVISDNKPDFLGVNFYAPAMVKYDSASPMRCNWSAVNPDTIKSVNGPVRPDQLYALLMRLKTEYGNPTVYITENGASFDIEDRLMPDGSVYDLHRAQYIASHVTAAWKAKNEGADLGGYFVWSGWDNFEWVFGYTKRFGIIRVDFNTLKRTPKKSFFTYQKIIKDFNTKLN